MASYPSGKGAVCKTVMQQFDSARRLFKGRCLSGHLFLSSSPVLAKPGADYIYSRKNDTPCVGFLFSGAFFLPVLFCRF